MAVDGTPAMIMRRLRMTVPESAPGGRDGTCIESGGAVNTVRFVPHPWAPARRHCQGGRGGGWA